MTPRPRPLLGLVLGMLLGLVVIGLLWQLALVDPGRTVLFLTVAVAVLAVAGLLTRQISAARGRFVTAAVIAGVLAGVGLTGIPELVSVGRVSDGCTLEVTAGGLTAAPSDTSALTAFSIAEDDVVEWAMTSSTPIAVDTRMAGVTVGGFSIPVRTVSSDPASGEAQEVTGTVDVADGLATIQDSTGLELTGVYHVYGEVSGEQATCAADGWVRLEPAGLFATNVLVGLWIALGVLLLLTAWAALAVRSSFVKARRAALEGERVHTGTVTTAAGGALAGGAGAGHVAADAEPSGTTSPEAAAEPVAPAPAFTPEARPEDMPPASIAPAPAAAGAAAGAGAEAQDVAPVEDAEPVQDPPEDLAGSEAESDADADGEPEPEPASDAEAHDEAEDGTDPQPEGDAEAGPDAGADDDPDRR
ncbi:hypothetical protein [Demequina lignilytica]|uniref:Uncharacterized protein n=1 Tax=Demequina lignilytica TaxID=3051663 RepID=A0AB35MEX9_9MICO|nr:hypothetical protein [Demequina sp. SYSU T0a273]MDN4482318.1 hypothetical protein [Demequina sp. SYSU T0a273]